MTDYEQEMSFWQQRQQRLQQSSLASTPTLRPSKTSPVHTTQQRTPLQDIAPANGAAPDSRASLDTYKRLVELAGLRQDVASALSSCQDAATVLSQEHLEHRQHAIQRLAAQHNAAAHVLATRQQNLHDVLHDIDNLASEYGNALKAKGSQSIVVPLHARQTRLQQRASQHMETATRPVVVHWGEGVSATQEAAQQAAMAALHHEVHALKTSMQQLQTQVQDAHNAQHAAEQRLRHSEAALADSRTQLQHTTSQLQDTTTRLQQASAQVEETQRAAQQALVDAEARHTQELVQRDALHAPLLAHLQEWAQRSPQLRHSMEETSGGGGTLVGSTLGHELVPHQQQAYDKGHMRVGPMAAHMAAQQNTSTRSEQVHRSMTNHSSSTLADNPRSNHVSRTYTPRKGLSTLAPPALLSPSPIAYGVGRSSMVSARLQPPGSRVARGDGGGVLQRGGMRQASIAVSEGGEHAVGEEARETRAVRDRVLARPPATRSTGTPPRTQPRRGGAAAQAQQVQAEGMHDGGNEQADVSPLEALASMMLGGSPFIAREPPKQGPNHQIVSEMHNTHHNTQHTTKQTHDKQQHSNEKYVDKRAAWLAAQQARMKAKAAALQQAEGPRAAALQSSQAERPVARRLPTEGDAAREGAASVLQQRGATAPTADGPRCIKCGVTQQQATQSRYAQCRFHPALLEDPGMLKFTPPWYSCRRAAHTHKQPGCFVRPNGHTFVDVAADAAVG